MDTDKKLELITRNLAEIINLDIMEKIVSKRPLRIYWGTAPTGRIHIGYLVPLLKIADFLKAGCEVKILFADLHAVLDNLKSTSKLVELRTLYYEKMIKAILKNLNVPLDNLTFVKGSTFQLSENYTRDVYRISTMTTIHDTKKAGAQVVKQSDNPLMSGLLYPILQALDEQYLDVDSQFGGIDQRKIFTFASDILPLLGYKKRIHLMNPMLTAINAMPKDISIQSGEDQNISDMKMSSSNINSKIDMIDSKNEIKKKINRAYCLEGDMTFNPLMELMNIVIFPLLCNLNITSFKINRDEKYGGPLEYQDYTTMLNDFILKKLHPQDLKNGIIEHLNNFIELIRQELATENIQLLIKKAYP